MLDRSCVLHVEYVKWYRTLSLKIEIEKVNENKIHRERTVALNILDCVALPRNRKNYKFRIFAKSPRISQIKCFWANTIDKRTFLNEFDRFYIVLRRFFFSPKLARQWLECCENIRFIVLPSDHVFDISCVLRLELDRWYRNLLVKNENWESQWKADSSEPYSSTEYPWLCCLARKSQK